MFLVLARVAPAEAEDAGYRRIELAAPRERPQSADRPPRMCRAGEKEEVGARSHGLARPPLDGRAPDQRERIGYGDALEAERAQQTVSRRADRRAKRRAS